MADEVKEVEPLSGQIKSPEELREFDRDLCIKWQSIKELLEFKHIADTQTITPVQARMYRGDLIGLFRYVIQVPEVLIYPNIIANGYNGPNDYNGDQLTFKVLAEAPLMQYYAAFSK